MKDKKQKRKEYAPPIIKKLNPVRVAEALRFKLSPPGGPPSVPGPAMSSPSVPSATVF